MTDAPGPQESGGPPPATVSRPMPPQQEPSTGSVPEGHPDTAPGHPSRTITTPDQDRETMAPLPPRRPQRRNPGLFDGEELRAIIDINANTPPCGLVAALRRHLQDVNRNRLFALVPLPHAGMQIADNVVDAWIWWFHFNQPDQERVWVPHLGLAHTLIAPPTEPRAAPSTGGLERAALQPRANAVGCPSENFGSP